MFSGLSAGTYSLSTSYDDSMNEKVLSGELSENEQLRLDLKLFGGFTVTCLVENPPEDIMMFGILSPFDLETLEEGEMFDFISDNEFQIVSSNVVNGMAEFRGIEPGTYTIVITAISMESMDFEEMTRATTQITIEEDDPMEIEVSVAF